MADEKIVPTGESSEEGEASKEEAGKETEQQTQQQSLGEQMKQLIQTTEEGRRELQSFKDKALKEIEVAQARVSLAEDRANRAEGTLEEMESGFKATDPEAAEKARLQAEVGYYRKQGATQAQRQQADAFDKSFQENMDQFITQMGIDPNDKRIDRGIDAKDYLSKQQRILTSVGKIQQEDAEKTKKVLEEGLDQRQKDFEAKIRKDLGLDTEETGVSPGVGGTDTDFLDKFGKGELPYTKENVDRANKLLSK